jgi:Lectin C-type domain
MRVLVGFVLGAAATAGCLRTTAFTCAQSTECGPGGVCESIGFCSVPDPDCVGTGRSYGASAGQGLANTCVPGDMSRPDAGVDAAVDAAIDAQIPTGCPAPYVQVAGSSHRYQALSGRSWDAARTACQLTSTAAYLAIPDDADELINLVTVVVAPFWLGLDDRDREDMFVTQKGAAAIFLPWAPGEPDDNMGGQDCVVAESAVQIATRRCGENHAVVCECEP